MKTLNTMLSIGEKLYGRRKGRPLPPERSRVMNDFLPRVKIDLPADPKLLDQHDLFPGQTYGQIWVEIGFGAGEHLISQALCNPQTGFIGCEAFINGIASLLASIDEHNIENIRIYPDDARQLLKTLNPRLLDRMFILFPDPWPKKRHHKRRLISEAFIGEAARIIKTGGELRLASDDQDYVRHIKDVLTRNPDFTLHPDSLADPHIPPEAWVETRYEKRGKRKGHICSYLSYIRL